MQESAPLPPSPSGASTWEGYGKGRESRYLGEQVHREAYAQAPGVQPKKRSPGAPEREEFLRACLVMRRNEVAWCAAMLGHDLSEQPFRHRVGSSIMLSPSYPNPRKAAQPLVARHPQCDLLPAPDGMPVRYLPRDFPPWQTVYYHFRRFRLSGYMAPHPHFAPDRGAAAHGQGYTANSSDSRRPKYIDRRGIGPDQCV